MAKERVCSFSYPVIERKSQWACAEVPWSAWHVQDKTGGLEPQDRACVETSAFLGLYYYPFCRAVGTGSRFRRNRIKEYLSWSSRAPLLGKELRFPSRTPATARTFLQRCAG